jgi:hypothetical protein
MPASVRSASRPTSIRAIAGVVRLQCSSGRSVNEYLKDDALWNENKITAGPAQLYKAHSCLECRPIRLTVDGKVAFPGVLSANIV